MSGKCGVAVSKHAVIVGDNGCRLVRGINVKIKGGIGSILTICEEDVNCKIKYWKSFVVDGDKIKADTYYCLKDGKLVEK